MQWALFLLIFNFQTMSWNYADIDGALVFGTQDECIKPMLMYNQVLQQEKYVFVCEPYTGIKNEEKPLQPKTEGEKQLEEMLDQYKDDTLNKPDTNETGNDIFKNLGLPKTKKKGLAV